MRAPKVTEMTACTDGRATTRPVGGKPRRLQPHRHALDLGGAVLGELTADWSQLHGGDVVADVGGTRLNVPGQVI